MAIQLMRWKPDTCECVLIQQYDTNTDTFSLSSYENVCAQHSSIVGDNNRYLTMRENNQRKNRIQGTLLEQFPALLGQTDAESGNIVWKNGIKFNWSFSGSGENRVLTISITGATLTTNQKNTIQSIADSTFGAGKVVVQ